MQNIHYQVKCVCIMQIYTPRYGVYTDVIGKRDGVIQKIEK